MQEKASCGRNALDAKAPSERDDAVRSPSCLSSRGGLQAEEGSASCRGQQVPPSAEAVVVMTMSGLDYRFLTRGQFVLGLIQRLTRAALRPYSFLSLSYWQTKLCPYESTGSR